MVSHAGTVVTAEIFEFEQKGVMGFVYERIMMRSKSMTKGMQRTLERVKSALEA